MQLMSNDPVVSAITLAASLAVLSFVSRFVIGSVEELIEITGLGETSAGFALLSVITSTPELLVAVFSVLNGAPSLSVGDLLGSNVFNLGIVVGVLMVTAGFLKQCPVGLAEIADILLISSLIPLMLVIFKVYNRYVGVILLAVFALTVYRETKGKSKALPITTDDKTKRAKSKYSILLKILAGTIIIVISARFTVSSALVIADFLGIPPIFIGARLVAFGTSLPELSLSLTAVRRRRVILASANAIGSNLTNLTLILGVVFFSSVFSPFSIDIMSFIEIISFVLVTSIIMWYYITKGGNCQIIGMILIITYVAFQATAMAE
jgi:cation:H+ antiporter